MCYLGGTHSKVEFINSCSLKSLGKCVCEKERKKRHKYFGFKHF